MTISKKKTSDSGCKDTNPKEFFGDLKLPLALWPTTASAMGCLGLLEGALKYGARNYRAMGVKASTYISACKRHLDSWFEGEELAPDSGIPHLANALACIAIIVDARAANMLNDDRPFPIEYRKFIDELTPFVKRLKELHKDKNPKHWTIKDASKSNETDK